MDSTGRGAGSECCRARCLQQQLCAAAPFALCLRGGVSGSSRCQPELEGAGSKAVAAESLVLDDSSVEIIADDGDGHAAGEAGMLPLQKPTPHTQASKQQRGSEARNGGGQLAKDAAADAQSKVPSEVPGFASAEQCRAALRTILDRPGLGE